MKLRAIFTGGHAAGKTRPVCWYLITLSALMILATLVWAPQPGAEIYQWTDENGVKHYSNSPPANAERVDIMFEEKPFDESAHRKRMEADQKELEALITKIKKEDQRARAAEQKKLKEAKEGQAPSQADLIEAERLRLSQKINELEARPFSYFGSESKRRAQIDYYRERLRLLQDNPERYFSRSDKIQDKKD